MKPSSKIWVVVAGFLVFAFWISGSFGMIFVVGFLALLAIICAVIWFGRTVGAWVATDSSKHDPPPGDCNQNPPLPPSGPAYCPKCGNELPPGGKFCGVCGTRSA